MNERERRTGGCRNGKKLSFFCVYWQSLHGLFAACCDWFSVCTFCFILLQCSLHCLHKCAVVFSVNAQRVIPIRRWNLYLKYRDVLALNQPKIMARDDCGRHGKSMQEASTHIGLVLALKVFSQPPSAPLPSANAAHRCCSMFPLVNQSQIGMYPNRTHGRGIFPSQLSNS